MEMVKNERSEDLPADNDPSHFATLRRMIKMRSLRLCNDKERAQRGFVQKLMETDDG
jgi:hypothetical protein